MLNLKNTDPKEYWKILKEGSHKEQPSIDFENRVKFFENLNKMKGNDDREMNIDLNNIDIDMIQNEEPIKIRRTLRPSFLVNFSTFAFRIFSHFFSQIFHL